MKYFQHRFDQVTGYLHHRSPYLLVDKVVDLQERRIVTQTTLSGNEFFIAGHFPGAPILPGAMMQEMTTQSAGILIAAQFNPMEVYNTDDPDFNEFALGVLVKVKHARYRGFARPGDHLSIEVELVDQVSQAFDFRARILVDGKTITQNAFQLTNIPTASLKGTAPEGPGPK